MRRAWRPLFVVALVLVFIASLLPSPDGPALVAHQDKYGHFAAFFILALLGIAAWPTHLARVPGGLLLYGMAIEIGQSFTAYRMGDVFDWLADALGILAASALSLLYRAMRRSRVGSPGNTGARQDAARPRSHP